MWSPVPPGRVRIRDDFWGPRRSALIDVTLPQQWDRLTESHAIENLRIVAGEAGGTHRGMMFADSDVWKWLEAASWMLPECDPGSSLVSCVDEVVGLAARAQAPDGYLNSYHQCIGDDLRWSSLLVNHELYCAGHFIEAACAHHESTSTSTALDVARRLADLVVDRFGPSGSGVPGHEEIELALCRLTSVTGDDRYLDQALRFVHRRGRSNRYPSALARSAAAAARTEWRARRARRIEAHGAGHGVPGTPAGTGLGFDWNEPGAVGRAVAQLWTGEYFQDAVPLDGLDSGVGHAVRALYLFSGATDCATGAGDTKLLRTLTRIWDRTVERRAYVTGGMGALPLVEGFGRDWELPNRSYAETCSAVGGARFTWRLLGALADPASTRMGDWLERTLYNGVLGGISLSGDRYFYRNPLVSQGEHERAPWFGVACCPPNVARTLAALGGTVWTEDSDGIQLHLLVGNTARFSRDGCAVDAVVECGLPWDGRLTIRFEVRDGPARFDLDVRIPAWAIGARIARDGATREVPARPGTYARLEGPWSDGDEVSLSLGLTPRWQRSQSQVDANRGRAALICGPLVYCAEAVDNPGLDVHSVVVDTATPPERIVADGLPPGITAFEVPGGSATSVRMVPYYAWANRGRTDMEVWLATADRRR